MVQTSNRAAWISSEKSPVLEVGPAPMPSPAENEVVIRVAYAAVNPTDWMMQDAPYAEVDYPFIFGTDVAGTIASLGPGVTRFEIGQRVVGHCDSLVVHHHGRAGFQFYTIVREILSAKVPASVALANAAVLPLALDTASNALYKNLTLPFPTLDPKPTGKTVLIWGGSSSVGATAIQLARASGWKVATTAGAHNQAFVKSLGAMYTFDHKHPDVVEEILKVLKPGDLVFDAVGQETSQKGSAEILSKLGGGVLPICLPPLPCEYKNVKPILVHGLNNCLVDLDIGDALWRKFVFQALEAGKLQAKPDPLILEGGLEKVQEGLNLLRKGVSAQKVVIEIDKEV